VNKSNKHLALIQAKKIAKAKNKVISQL